MHEDSRKVAAALRQLVSEHFDIDLPAGESSLLDHDLPLDSVSLVQLIVLIEEHFRIQFQEHELRPDTFRDLRSLATLIASKVGSSS